MEIRLRDLADELGGRVIGDDDIAIVGVETLDRATPSHISFYTNPRYKKAFLSTRAGAVIVSERHAQGEVPQGPSLLVVDEPYLAFAKVSTRFHQPPRYEPGIDPRAAIDEGAEVDPTATVFPFAYVGRGVKVGKRAVIHAHCAILDGAVIGDDCVLYPGVVVREGCIIGPRTIIQPGAIIGADGFGFAFEKNGPHGPRHFKVPQVGKVVIGADVEIGANTCIDRGTVGDTKVGDGAKIDDLVMLAHNVEVGPLSLLAGCAAIAGSTRLGPGVVVGGQVGIIGHLEIGAGAKIAAGSRVMTDLAPGSENGGSPAVSQQHWLREQAARQRLPELLKQVRELVKRIEELEQR